ncbi:squalene synthetase-like protein [Coemansia javaensis]|uniref:Squalene synthetase-like protein n=1 Tax=Coemansia javaensis TaxID=2761396 RepID=A0A9W8HG05_9FUNG|nr:squalene synthetase-like protein [Coemansia javaensis]
MKRLNAQFVGLGVQGQQEQPQQQRKPRGRRGGRRTRGRRPGAAKGQPATGTSDDHGDDDDDDDDDDEAANDYMAHASDGGGGGGELQRMAFLARGIGGGHGVLVESDVEYSDDGTSSAGGGQTVEDPYRYYDEDDGFPQDMDMQQVPGPGGSPQASRRRRQHGRRQKQKQRGGAAAGPERQTGGAPSGFDPYTLLKRLDALTMSRDMDSIWLQPMDKKDRQIVHVLAREYRVKSKSHGNGVRRAPVLTATPDSCPPQNRKRINKVLLLFDQRGSLPDSWAGGPQPAEGGRGKKGRGGKASSSSNNSGSLNGRLVAEGAPEVGASNIGHKMLQQMGWTPGTGLGAEEKRGRATPVDIEIRAGRRGLGA